MKQIYCLLLGLTFFLVQEIKAQPFVTVWDLSIPGSSSNGFSFSANTTGIVNYTWETIPAGTSGSGTFTGGIAAISGLPPGTVIRLIIDPTNLNRVIMGPGSDVDRLIDVEQWGAVHWTSMENAFEGCYNLNISATDLPDLSNVSSFLGMFRYCSSLSGPSNIDAWNTQNVTNMCSMFANAPNFNQPLGSWNTQNVTNMTYMFLGASLFNQPIGSWNTQNVTGMGGMFAGATSFNQPIGNWNISNVVYMWDMFKNASSFNQPIGSWNTQNVVAMSYMFQSSTSFNQPIGSWNTQNVTEMRSMFSGAIAFNQPIGNWDIANVIHMDSMFFGAQSFNQSLGNWQLRYNVIIDDMLDSSGLDCANYSATIYGWRYNPNIPYFKHLGAIGLKYYDSVEVERTYLDNIMGWLFYGDKLANQNCCVKEFIIKAGANLSATTSGATYQWLSCNPYQIISGATNQNYTATANGDYAVIVTENGCTDTSACVTVMGIGLDNNEIDEGISIYPNPTKNKLYVNSGSIKVEPQTNIEIYNTLGQLLLTKDINPHTQTGLDISHLAKGMYYLRVGHVVAKVIVE